MNRENIIVELCEGDKILDLGCVQHRAKNESNDNWLHGLLVDEFDYVLGIDTRYHEVQKLQNKGYNILSDDAVTMNIDEKFDTIVMGELIEHIDNPGLLLENMKNHLKNDGKIVLSTPYVYGIRYQLRYWYGTPDINKEHIAWYGPIVLKQLLKRHRFYIENQIKWTHPAYGGIAGKLTYILEELGLTAMTATTLIIKAKRL